MGIKCIDVDFSLYTTLLVCGLSHSVRGLIYLNSFIKEVIKDFVIDSKKLNFVSISNVYEKIIEPQLWQQVQGWLLNKGKFLSNIIGSGSMLKRNF